MVRILLLLCAFAAAAKAQNAPAESDPFVGTFQRDQVSLQLGGAKGQYSGSITVQGRRLSVSAKASGDVVTGTFDLDGKSYAFTLTPYAGGLKLTAEGLEYRLERTGAAPAEAPKSGSGIVGNWRSAQGTARFNADGTGVMDGNAGRYEISGNQITLIVAQGRVTLGFELRGDTLTLTGPLGQLVLNRVREEAGPGRIRQEMVGKWCWVSVVNAQQGARTSNQCFVLNADGSYQYSGESDSYNPNGGSTSQSADSGTWTATETTLTANSRSRGTIVYAIEKRNHPKTGDPMLVLNGQAFVTFFQHAPW